MTVESIRARLAEVQRAAENVATLERTLDGLRASPVSEELRQAVRQKVVEYEDACAARTLGDGSDEAVAAAKSALDVANQSLQAIELANRQTEGARAGVARRLEAANQAHEAALSKLTAAEVEWALAEVAAADQIYVEAAGATSASIARLVALYTWLENHGHRIRIPYKNRQCPPLHPLGPASVEAYKAIFPTHTDINWSQTIARPFHAPDALAVIEHELNVIKGERVPSLANRVLRSAMAAFGASKPQA